MYETHALLKEPSKDSPLWRYMDFPKFFSILENKSLFFPRITNLEDPFEGHPPRLTVEAYKDTLNGLEGEELLKATENVKHTLQVFQNSRSLSCISCWHVNTAESAAMWELYLRSGEGIAIRSTFERFMNAFPKSNVDVHGGLVEYVDYDTFKPSRMNTAMWAMLKRIGFEHECEFRGIVLDPLLENSGISVPIDLDILIEDIYVSPTTPTWMTDLLQNMIRRYGLDLEVKCSKLRDQPMYYKIQDGI